MKKYYFAYHDVNGILFPFTWAEEDGICCGGRPHYVKDTKIEISQSDADLDLGILERLHPLCIPSLDFTSGE